MKRLKANVYDLRALDINYCNFQYVTNRSTGAKGTAYNIDGTITDAQKEGLAKFKNVVFTKCHYRYAPEIVYDVIILLDRCLQH